jgi:dTDP-4-amino-4,6-dideoxygalactose transaminase
LHLSLLSIGIRDKDEVLVADYTFPATGHAVLYCRATPVFVDVDLQTYNMNPDVIEEKITEKTRAIIPVHTFGQPADMDEIITIAREHDLTVIEDSACALGAVYKNQYAGTIGDIGCFSFHARKGITTGEGGMVVTDNQDLADKIRKLSVFGMVSAWDREKSGRVVIPEFTELGYNYKMSDINAAIGIAQLRKLDKIIEKKRMLATYWDEILEPIDLIEAPYISRNRTHVYQSYVALVDTCVKRNSVIERLMAKGIQTQIGTYASHIQPVYSSSHTCLNSLEIFNRSLALPLYYTLEKEDIEKVAAHLRNALEEST